MTRVLCLSLLESLPILLKPLSTADAVSPEQVSVTSAVSPEQVPATLVVAVLEQVSAALVVVVV